jgi:hypothetical protein
MISKYAIVAGMEVVGMVHQGNTTGQKIRPVQMVRMLTTVDYASVIEENRGRGEHGRNVIN